jgi:hypothetical protein
MAKRLERFGLMGLVGSCLTVWGGYFYLLASTSVH